MAHVGERRDRSRSSREVVRGGAGDQVQDLPPDRARTLSQEVGDYLALVRSQTVFPVLADPTQKKRKRQSSSQEAADQVQDLPPDRARTLSQEVGDFLASVRSQMVPPVFTDPARRKRKRQSSNQITPDDERPSTSLERPSKRSRREVYSKGRLLGRGGFGSVYAGTRRSDGLPVAIKHVSKRRAQRLLEVEGQGLLPVEVALMTRVSSAPACPNIIQLLEWFDHPLRYILILERPVPCQDLTSFCKDNGWLDEDLAKSVLLQLITALKHCESRGVLHRDVKPDNMLISTTSHTIKLLDFGCGELLKDSAYNAFAGTRQYAPPEWFQQHSYDAGPSTVWSVGVTIYKVLCGCCPFITASGVTSNTVVHFPSKLSAVSAVLVPALLSEFSLVADSSIRTDILVLREFSFPVLSLCFQELLPTVVSLASESGAPPSPSSQFSCCVPCPTASSSWVPFCQ